jgi:hypothetical protein
VLQDVTLSVTDAQGQSNTTASTLTVESSVPRGFAINGEAATWCHF